MTLSIRSALPTIAIPSALGPREGAKKDPSPGVPIGSAPTNGPAADTPVERAERFGLTIADNSAQALREHAASTAAITIHWTPWQRAYSASQKGPGNWINTST